MISETKIFVKKITTRDPTMPPLVVQVTRMADTYMIWVGVGSIQSEDGKNAAVEGRLCKDWACAMPPRNTGVPASATALFGSEVALSMSQRLAKRFGKQIFLSVDISNGLGDSFEAEKGIVETLKDIEMNM